MYTGPEYNLDHLRHLPRVTPQEIATFILQDEIVAVLNDVAAPSFFHEYA